MQKSFLPKLAFETLKQAEESYNQNGFFSPDILETLHSFFEDLLTSATELLEHCKIYKYSTTDRCRTIYKIITSRDQYALFDNINFCSCEDFSLKVLQSRTSLTCKHVLAVHLAKITNSFKEEIISSQQFEEFLNGQVEVHQAQY